MKLPSRAPIWAHQGGVIVRSAPRKMIVVYETAYLLLSSFKIWICRLHGKKRTKVNLLETFGNQRWFSKDNLKIWPASGTPWPAHESTAWSTHPSKTVGSASYDWTRLAVLRKTGVNSTVDASPGFSSLTAKHCKTSIRHPLDIHYEYPRFSATIGYVDSWLKCKSISDTFAKYLDFVWFPSLCHALSHSLRSQCEPRPEPTGHDRHDLASDCWNSSRRCCLRWSQWETNTTTMTPAAPAAPATPAAPAAPASSTGVDSTMGSCGGSHYHPSSCLSLTFKLQNGRGNATDLYSIQRAQRRHFPPEPQLPQVFHLPPGPGHWRMHVGRSLYGLWRLWEPNLTHVHLVLSKKYGCFELIATYDCSAWPFVKLSSASLPSACESCGSWRFWAEVAPSATSPQNVDCNRLNRLQ